MTVKPELLDVVELVSDVPEANHIAGDQGTVVEMFPGHDVVLVEFDPVAEALDIYEVPTSALRVVWRVGEGPRLRSSA